MTPLSLPLAAAFALALVACGGNVVVDSAATSSDASGVGGASFTTGSTSTGAAPGGGGGVAFGGGGSAAVGGGGSVPGCDDSYPHIVGCIPPQDDACPGLDQSTQDAVAAAVHLCSLGGSVDCCGEPMAVYSLATCTPSINAAGTCCYVADLQSVSPCGGAGHQGP